MAQQAKPASATHWRNVHRRKNVHLLFAEDIGGRPVDVEIVDSGVETVSGAKKGDEKDMPWLAFAGKKKRLALNVTNCKTMTTIAGTPVIERWRGWITLIVVKTSYYDQMTGKTETTDAIRIAPERPQRGASQQQQTQGASAPAESPPPTTPPAPPPGQDQPLTPEEQRAIAMAEAAEEEGRG